MREIAAIDFDNFSLAEITASESDGCELTEARKRVEMKDQKHEFEMMVKERDNMKAKAPTIMHTLRPKQTLNVQIFQCGQLVDTESGALGLLIKSKYVVPD